MPLNQGYVYRERLGEAARGRTLLAYLSERYPHSSALEWQARIEEGLVLVDAIPDTGEPGAVRVFEAGDTAPTAVGVDAHGMDPASVFATLAALGGSRPRTIVVGCQAQCVDEGIGLSPVVAAAVEPAAAAVSRAVQMLRRPDRAARPRPGG